ncbi:MAG: tripartite tricarboxylate transporter TctB family protein [Bacillota bacterium]|nr:tripartite tricarboxylate transporter TctB family protein [Bacillota bacterium]
MVVRNEAVTTGLIGITLGAFGLAQAWSLPVFARGVPQEGFMPLLIGGALLITGVSLLVGGLVRGQLTTTVSSAAPRTTLYLMCLVVAYVFLLQIVGFLLSTWILCTGTIRAWRRYGWPAALLYGGIISLLLHLCFSAWMKMPLPRPFWA